MKAIYSGLQNPSQIYVYNTADAVIMVRQKPNQRKGYNLLTLVAIFKITYHSKR